jgi:hypothetical protein
VTSTSHGTFFESVIQLSRGELLDRVLQIEERLRQLIRAVLSDVRPDWEKLVPDKIRTHIEESGPPKARTDILDRANLGQLIGIVLARWKYFSELLGDKPTFHVRANEFKEWRNSLAHGASPSPDEKLEIALLVRQVGQQIPVVAGLDLTERSKSVTGSVVVWADDNPEWNLAERQILRSWHRGHSRPHQR